MNFTISLDVINIDNFKNQIDDYFEKNKDREKNSELILSEFIDNKYTYIFSLDSRNKIYELGQLLDALRSLNSNLRYNIIVYEENKKYPTSIRINKKGEKIITKNQTKIYCYY